MTGWGLLAVLVTDEGTGFFGGAFTEAPAAGLAATVFFVGDEAGFLAGAEAGFLAGALAAPLEAALGAERAGALAAAFLTGAFFVVLLGAAFFFAVAAGFLTAFFDDAALFAGDLLTGLSSLRLYTREQGREFKARGL